MGLHDVKSVPVRGNPADAKRLQGLLRGTLFCAASEKNNHVVGTGVDLNQMAQVAESRRPVAPMERDGVLFNITSCCAVPMNVMSCCANGA
jgi:hypothetical protein